MDRRDASPAIVTPASPSAEALLAWRRADLVLLVLIVALGAYLRLDQFAAQVLLDDEWHAVHEILRKDPRSIPLSLGTADYGIPLAFYDLALVHTVGLTEVGMRLPMMLCALAALLLFPLAVAKRVGRRAALAFAALLALSPVLIAYSEIARPYAITVLLGWYAHWAFRRYWSGSRADGVAYVAAAAFACWLHLVSAPFVLAPLAWALVASLRDPRKRRERIRRVLAVGIAAAVAIAVLVGPPLVATPAAISGKSGFTLFGVSTLAGAAHWWTGSKAAWAVIAALVLAAVGMPRVWRALPEARTGVLGLALTVAALAVSRPEWGDTPVVFARYLYPAVPLLLLAMACGAIDTGRAIAGRVGHEDAWTTALATSAVLMLAVTSPLRAWTVHPSSHRTGLVFLYDFRDGPNAARDVQNAIPLSAFWGSLAGQPRDSLLIAAAPFRFESYDWDGSRWERKSRQRVIPGWLNGLCTPWRAGELPVREGYAFRNAVRLADPAAVAARGVDYVVWQKPWVPHEQDRLVRAGDDTSACEPALRAAYGPPAWEDAQVIAFRVRAAEGRSDARR